MKKLCLIYANCQGRGIDTFLQKSATFRECYRTEIVENYLLITNNSPLPLGALKKADLFIYQPVAAKHGVYASDNLKKHLPSHCLAISFPYLYNDALWPLFEEGAKIKGKEAILLLIEQGLSLKRIADMFCAGQIDFQFERRFRESMAILRAKEASTDVKAADFIMEKLGTEKLFLTQNHQTSILYMHCVNQILATLQLPLLVSSDTIHPNEAHLPDCWPQSPYETELYGLRYRCGWEQYHPEKKDSNWHRFYLRVIGKIYLSYPMPRVQRLFWQIYLRLRIKWSLMRGAGYLGDDRSPL